MARRSSVVACVFDLLHNVNSTSKRDEVRRRTWGLTGTGLLAQQSYNFLTGLRPSPRHPLHAQIFQFAVRCIQTRRTRRFGNITQRLTPTATIQLPISLVMNISGSFRTLSLEVGEIKKFWMKRLDTPVRRPRKSKIPPLVIPDAYRGRIPS